MAVRIFITLWLSFAVIGSCGIPEPDTENAETQDLPEPQEENEESTTESNVDDKEDQQNDDVETNDEFSLQDPFLSSCKKTNSNLEAQKTASELMLLVNASSCEEGRGKLEEKKQINMKGRDIENIEPLASFEQLEELDISETAVEDITPISHLNNIVSLDLMGTKVKNLRVLLDKPQAIRDKITYLGMNTLMDNIDGLSEFPNLEKLVFRDYPFATLEALAPLKNMKVLHFLNQANFSDLGPLANMTKLTDLSIDQSNVQSLGPLSALVSLEYLVVMESPIADLTPMAGLTNLLKVGFYGTSISSLSALEGLTKLRQVFVGATLIATPEVERFKSLRPLVTIYH